MAIADSRCTIVPVLIPQTAILLKEAHQQTSACNIGIMVSEKYHVLCTNSTVLDVI